MKSSANATMKLDIIITLEHVTIVIIQTKVIIFLLMEKHAVANVNKDIFRFSIRNNALKIVLLLVTVS